MSPVKRYLISRGALLSAENLKPAEVYRLVDADDYDELARQLALALKVPSVAAIHCYLDTECAKQNVQLAAERDRLKADANLCRQWFNAVQDLNPKYLEAADYAAAARLVEP